MEGQSIHTADHITIEAEKDGNLIDLHVFEPGGTMTTEMGMRAKLTMRGLEELISVADITPIERVPVLVQAEAPDADFYEMNVVLPARPQKGDSITLWHDNTEHYFEVRGVVLPEQDRLGGEIRVDVDTSGYFPEDVKAIFASKDRP